MGRIENPAVDASREVCVPLTGVGKILGIQLRVAGIDRVGDPRGREEEPTIRCQTRLRGACPTAVVVTSDRNLSRCGVESLLGIAVTSNRRQSSPASRFATFSILKPAADRRSKRHRTRIGGGGKRELLSASLAARGTRDHLRRVSWFGEPAGNPHGLLRMGHGTPAFTPAESRVEEDCPDGPSERPAVWNGLPRLSLTDPHKF